MIKLKTWQVYLAFGIIVFLGAISLKRNYTFANLNEFNNIGYINMFIYSYIIGNTFLPLLLPFIVGVLSSIYCKHITDKISSTLRSSLYVGITLLLMMAIIFIIFIPIDPTPSFRMINNRSGLYIPVLDRSLLLYCICYVVHISIVASCYAFLSLEIMRVKNSLYYSIIWPGFLHYTLSLFIYIFPTNIRDFCYYFIPYLSFDIKVSNNYLNYVFQIIFIVIVGLLLNKMYRKKGVIL